MNCKNCGEKIKFSQYLLEAINPFKRSMHICRICKKKYNVKTHFWHLTIFFTMALKMYKYWLKNTCFIYLNLKETVILSIIAISVIYIFCLIEQIVFFLCRKDKS